MNGMPVWEYLVVSFPARGQVYPSVICRDVFLLENYVHQNDHERE